MSAVRAAVLLLILSTSPGCGSGTTESNGPPSGAPGNTLDGASDGTTDGAAPDASTSADRAATPLFSVPGGHYDIPQSVQVTTTTPGAIIHYTVDGSAPDTDSPTYGSAVLIGVGTTVLRALAVAPAFEPSLVATATYVIEAPSPPVAAAPSLDPPGGTYSEPLTVVMSSSSPGVQVHYTADGTMPDSHSPIYSSPLPISDTTTLAAFATGAGYLDSLVTKATYTFLPKAATPSYAPPGGSYVGLQTVWITTVTPGASIYYTTDGSTPSASSTLFTMPLPISSSTAIRAIASAPGHADSEIADATYSIMLATAPPVASPPGGSYASPVYVTLSCATPGAEIRYTLDNTDPTPASALYAAPIPVCAQVLKAYASADGFAPSPIVANQYFGSCDFQAAAPTIYPNGGTFDLPQEVLLATTEPSGTIIYTLDGTLPTIPQSPVYDEPFIIAQSATVYAVTVAPGKQNSNPATAVFIIVQ